MVLTERVLSGPTQCGMYSESGITLQQDSKVALINNSKLTTNAILIASQTTLHID